MNQEKPYYGKYRGLVEANEDPKRLGRLKVAVPEVFGIGTSSWAVPCVPYAGPEVGWFAMPPVGADVWVEFEAGDPSRPIWTGCYWREGGLPLLAESAEVKLLVTEGTRVKIDDTPDVGGFELVVGPPALPFVVTVTANETGLSISVPDSSIKILPESIVMSQAPAEVSITPEVISSSVGSGTVTISEPTVSINEGALTID